MRFRSSSASTGTSFPIFKNLTAAILLVCFFKPPSTHAYGPPPKYSVDSTTCGSWRSSRQNQEQKRRFFPTSISAGNTDSMQFCTKMQQQRQSQRKSAGSSTALHMMDPISLLGLSAASWLYVNVMGYDPERKDKDKTQSVKESKTTTREAGEAEQKMSQKPPLSSSPSEYQTTSSLGISTDDEKSRPFLVDSMASANNTEASSAEITSQKVNVETPTANFSKLISKISERGSDPSTTQNPPELAVASAATTTTRTVTPPYVMPSQVGSAVGLSPGSFRAKPASYAPTTASWKTTQNSVPVATATATNTSAKRQDPMSLATNNPSEVRSASAVPKAKSTATSPYVSPSKVGSSVGMSPGSFRAKSAPYASTAASRKTAQTQDSVTHPMKEKDTREDLTAAGAKDLGSSVMETKLSMFANTSAGQVSRGSAQSVPSAQNIASSLFQGEVTSNSGGSVRANPSSYAPTRASWKAQVPLPTSQVSTETAAAASDQFVESHPADRKNNEASIKLPSSYAPTKASWKSTKLPQQQISPAVVATNTDPFSSFAPSKLAAEAVVSETRAGEVASMPSPDASSKASEISKPPTQDFSLVANNAGAAAVSSLTPTSTAAASVTVSSVTSVSREIPDSKTGGVESKPLSYAPTKASWKSSPPLKQSSQEIVGIGVTAASSLASTSASSDDFVSNKTFDSRTRAVESKPSSYAPTRASWKSSPASRQQNFPTTLTSFAPTSKEAEQAIVVKTGTTSTVSSPVTATAHTDLSIPYDAATRLAFDNAVLAGNAKPGEFEVFKKKYLKETIAMVIAKKNARDQKDQLKVVKASSRASVSSGKSDTRATDLKRSSYAPTKASWKSKPKQDLPAAISFFGPNSAASESVTVPVASVSGGTSDTRATDSKPSSYAPTKASWTSPPQQQDLPAAISSFGPASASSVTVLSSIPSRKSDTRATDSKSSSYAPTKASWKSTPEQQNLPAAISSFAPASAASASVTVPSNASVSFESSNNRMGAVGTKPSSYAPTKASWKSTSQQQDLPAAVGKGTAHVASFSPTSTVSAEAFSDTSVSKEIPDIDRRAASKPLSYAPSNASWKTTPLPQKVAASVPSSASTCTAAATASSVRSDVSLDTPGSRSGATEAKLSSYAPTKASWKSTPLQHKSPVALSSSVPTSTAAVPETISSDDSVSSGTLDSRTGPPGLKPLSYAPTKASWKSVSIPKRGAQFVEQASLTPPRSATSGTTASSDVSTNESWKSTHWTSDFLTEDRAAGQDAPFYSATSAPSPSVLFGYAGKDPYSSFAPIRATWKSRELQGEAEADTDKNAVLTVASYLSSFYAAKKASCKATKAEGPELFRDNRSGTTSVQSKLRP